MTARRRDQLESVAGRCRVLGAPRVAIQCADLAGKRAGKRAVDGAKEGAHESIANEAWELMDGIDVVVHNAGLSQRSMAVETDPEVVRKIMAVNFFAPVNMTRALLPRLRERSGAQVAAVGSVTGYVSTPMRSTYAASKHALRAWFDALRAEEHRHGIRVTLISPGFVRTDLSRNALTGDRGLWRKMDRGQARGVSPKKCARKSLKAIEKGRREVLIGGSEVAGVYLSRWAPGLLALLIRNIKAV